MYHRGIYSTIILVVWFSICCLCMARIGTRIGCYSKLLSPLIHNFHVKEHFSKSVKPPKSSFTIELPLAEPAMQQESMETIGDTIPNTRTNIVDTIQEISKAEPSIRNFEPSPGPKLQDSSQKGLPLRNQFGSHFSPRMAFEEARRELSQRFQKATSCLEKAYSMPSFSRANETTIFLFKAFEKGKLGILRSNI